jgi:hypothetical protein
MRRSLVWLALPLLACTEEDPGPAHDPEQVIAEAIEFESTLERLDNAPFMSQHLEGVGLATAYADAESAELFRTLVQDLMQLEPPTGVVFAEGSLLVKENFDLEGNPVDVLNVMAKFEPGYNPNGNDWFFAAITRDGEVIDAGLGPISGKGAEVEFCRDCHSQMGANTDLVIGLLPEQLN